MSGAPVSGIQRNPPDRPPPPPAATRLPAGFRWIAVRPGPPPPQRRRRRPLGPTPRYATVPRWGLLDRVAAPAAGTEHTARKNASPEVVRAALLAAAGVFALAAAVHILRYLLLLINRTTLLHPWIANGVLLMGVLVSLAAIVAVIVTAALLTSWLIGRRAAVFRHHGQEDPRPEWALWAGCMVPVANLVWAPLFVIELAHAEQTQTPQRGPITMWWIGWVFSTAITGWAIWTSTATDAQAVADNTVAVIIAYLAGLAVLLLLWRVIDGFVRKPVDRPLHRWVIVPADQSDETPPPVRDDTPPGSGTADHVETETAVESGDREPAA